MFNFFNNNKGDEVMARAKLSKTEKAVATTTEAFVLLSFIQYIIGLIAMFLMN